MKTRLSFFALLLCVLFFACKKNDILTEETVEVSAVEESGPTFGVSTPELPDIPPIIILNDKQSQHTFGNCINIPSNIPFYINAGMIQGNQILIEYETNPSYTGTKPVNSMILDYCISTKSNFIFSSDFSDCTGNSWQHYYDDNLIITIPQTYDDVKLSIQGTCFTIGGPTYTFSFYHIVNKYGSIMNQSIDYDFGVIEGSTTSCICPVCSQTYTLIMP